MPRAVDGTRRAERRKKILKDAKGFYGRRSTNFQCSQRCGSKSRRLFIQRQKAGKKENSENSGLQESQLPARQNDINYSQFMYGLSKAGIELNRKALSNMAIEDPKAFTMIVEKSKAAIGAK